MKKRIVDDSSEDVSNSGAQATLVGQPAKSLVDKEILSHSGLYSYKYRLSSFPPNVQEHDQLSKFLGVLIPKLMVATKSRLEPFIFLDGRFFTDELFNRIKQSGAAWRPLLGFPVIPGFHPFRYLTIAFHIQ